MALLSFEDIRKQVTVDVEVPTLKGSVRLAKLGAHKQVEVGRHYSAYPKNDRGEPSDEDALAFMLLVASKSIVDESGKCTFDSDEGRAVLASLTMVEIEKIGDAALELNGMRGTAVIDNAKKNSKKARTGRSRSTSAKS
jgi:hypothetical protein